VSGAAYRGGMARVGGRNTLFAWGVGLVCAGIVGALVWLAAPLVPAGLAFLEDRTSPPTSEPVAGDGEEVADAAPSECRDLYSDSLWSSLVWADDSVLTPSEDAPEISAQGFADALAPAVRLTCTWTSAEGDISTTLASVASDAGAIAKTALPSLGYSCTSVAQRTRCTLDADGRLETIEAGGGVWLSSVLDRWRPARYVDETAERVWAEEPAD